MSDDPKKAKKAKKQKGGESSDEHVRLSTHPDAVASVKRTRARCGLGGFVGVLALCLLAHVPIDAAVFRALLAGCACHLVGWWASIALWRSVIRMQVQKAAEAYNDRIRKAHQDAADRAAHILTAQAAAEAEASASFTAKFGS
jgi:hypothetical protein